MRPRCGESPRLLLRRFTSAPQPADSLAISFKVESRCTPTVTAAYGEPQRFVCCCGRLDWIGSASCESSRFISSVIKWGFSPLADDEMWTFTYERTRFIDALSRSYCRLARVTRYIYFPYWRISILCFFLHHCINFILWSHRQTEWPCLII